jgi:hypothetical protein
MGLVVVAASGGWSSSFCWLPWLRVEVGLPSSTTVKIHREFDGWAQDAGVVAASRQMGSLPWLPVDGVAARAWGGGDGQSQCQWPSEHSGQFVF